MGHQIRSGRSIVLRGVFIAGLMLAASGIVSPPIALAVGLAFGLLLPHPFDRGSRVLSRYLLQASVVGLGFGMNLHEIVRVGRAGFLYTILSIAFAMVAGMSLGRLLKVERTSAFLIS